VNFFSLLNELVSGSVCMEELFIEMEVTSYHLKNT
jgi:hypothetical protein